jgi:hypothetical protein
VLQPLDLGAQSRQPFLRRRRGRRETIAPAGLEEATPAPPGVNRGLAVMVARAHRWRELLGNGQYGTVRALAARMGVNSSYVGRLLNLALLAPDIVEAIVTGREPDGLTLRKLRRMPVEWEEERRGVGDGMRSGRSASLPD